MDIKQQYGWLLDFTGCDGGNIGSPENPSIWVCGIEWGGGHDADSLRKMVATPYDDTTDFGYDDWTTNIKYPYNVRTCKLLSALNGGQTGDYREFAEKVQPFVNGSPSPYFRMNLYPIAFKNTDPNRWNAEFADITGFRDKSAYADFCRKYRFAEMHRWMETYRPRLIICFGRTFEKDFNLAFSDGLNNFNQETIGDRVLKWKRNENGTLLAVLPFPSGPSGLNSDHTMQLFGERLAELLRETV
ncbi:hypothetical protein [Neisseria perflava]|uniref:hypothetical protein n=1 Tax=Neisseria perflava TaxID=33053 RepID=UPI0020A14441|nr:hypothetical protein [Neisseria perflava]MCP1660127.1 hypothetical protein [Neisseria perflava]MCP1772739.1 hypothetical protein [Neisseria perflava]